MAKESDEFTGHVGHPYIWLGVGLSLVTLLAVPFFLAALSYMSWKVQASELE